MRGGGGGLGIYVYAGLQIKGFAYIEKVNISSLC